MNDYVLIGQAYNQTVRIYVATSTTLVEEARSIHQTMPTATAALGRFLTAGAMMGLMYKEGERITLRIKGDGPIGSMTIEASGSGYVRGDITNPHVYLTYEDGPKKGKLNVGQAVGKGFLFVTKDLNMKEYYTSSSELISGEIAEDFTYYFTTSEQTNSSVALGVLVHQEDYVLHSGGYIIQLMPGVEEATIVHLEQLLKTIPSVTEMMQDGKTPEMMFDLLSHHTGVVLDKKSIAYHCPCSYEGFLSSLSALSKETLLPLADEDHGAHIQCHFCKKEYDITENDLRALIRLKD